MSTSTLPAARQRLFRLLEPTAWQGIGLSPVNRVVVGAIVASALVAILDSEPAVTVGREQLFNALEIVFGVLFGAEYLARVWTSAENPKYGPGLLGKLRYMRSPAAVLDLLAVTPMMFTIIGGEAYLLRLFRLVRVLRMARLGRFSTALASLTGAVRSRRFELMVSVAIAGLLLLVTSTLLYFVEGTSQPDNFGSIPHSHHRDWAHCHADRNLGRRLQRRHATAAPRP